MFQGKMQRAVDVLPASAEYVTLTGNTLNREFEQQFLMDLYRPSFYYPRLRRLSVDDSWVSPSSSKSYQVALVDHEDWLIVLRDSGQARYWKRSIRFSERISQAKLTYMDA